MFHHRTLDVEFAAQQAMAALNVLADELRTANCSPERLRTLAEMAREHVALLADERRDNPAQRGGPKPLRRQDHSAVVIPFPVRGR